MKSERGGGGRPKKHDWEPGWERQSWQQRERHTLQICHRYLRQRWTGCHLGVLRGTLGPAAPVAAGGGRRALHPAPVHVTGGEVYQTPSVDRAGRFGTGTVEEPAGRGGDIEASVARTAFSCCGRARQVGGPENLCGARFPGMDCRALRGLNHCPPGLSRVPRSSSSVSCGAQATSGATCDPLRVEGAPHGSGIECGDRAPRHSRDAHLLRLDWRARPDRPPTPPAARARAHPVRTTRARAPCAARQRATARPPARARAAHQRATRPRTARAARAARAARESARGGARHSSLV